MQAQTKVSYGETSQDMQYAFDTLVQCLGSKNRHADVHSRVSTPPAKKKKPGAAPNGQVKQKDQVKQKEYGSLHRIARFAAVSSRVDKLHSSPKLAAPSQKKGRHGDEKIMLPAPQPTPEYLSQASEEPSVIDTHHHMLIILDLNGTVLYRPNKNAKTMIERPFLRPFLRYLFQNFSVMVWSSAKPENVKSLVMQSLDKDLQSKLVARWARDSFGLSPTNYGLNVQVYKNLKLVWSRDVIQQYHPEYAAGKRFGQHNTVLIDDSALKANAQPHNLLEIPEFSATPEQMQGDVLRKVAGYLEFLRQQTDVSKFIHKEPFQDDDRWDYQWPDDTAGGGEMETKVSTNKKKKNKKSKNAGRNKANTEVKDADASNGTQTEATANDALAEATSTPSSKTTDLSVPPAASLQKDW